MVLHDKGAALSVVGTGKAARFLLRLFAELGVSTIGVWGRRHAAAAELARVHRATHYRHLDQLVERSSVVFLSVSDGALAATAGRLASEASSAVFGTTFAHLSGIEGVDCLLPLAKLGAIVGSVHPMMSLYDGCPLADIHFFAHWTDERFASTLRPLVEANGNVWHELGVTAKPAYHAAATVLCQGVAAAVETARELFSRSTLGEEVFRAALGPLARATVAARLANEDTSSLTGPAVRGDETTIRAHRQVLAAPSDGALLEYYDALTDVVRLLHRKGSELQ